MEYALYITLGVGAAWLLKQNTEPIKEKMTYMSVPMQQQQKQTTLQIDTPIRTTGPRPRITPIKYDADDGTASFSSTLLPTHILNQNERLFAKGSRVQF